MGSLGASSMGKEEGRESTVCRGSWQHLPLSPLSNRRRRSNGNSSSSSSMCGWVLPDEEKTFFLLHHRRLRRKPFCQEVGNGKLPIETLPVATGRQQWCWKWALCYPFNTSGHFDLRQYLFKGCLSSFFSQKQLPMNIKYIKLQ